MKGKSGEGRGKMSVIRRVEGVGLANVEKAEDHWGRISGGRAQRNLQKSARERTAVLYPGEEWIARGPGGRMGTDGDLRPGE